MPASLSLHIYHIQYTPLHKGAWVAVLLRYPEDSGEDFIPATDVDTEDEDETIEAKAKVLTSCYFAIQTLVSYDLFKN